MPLFLFALFAFLLRVYRPLWLLSLTAVDTLRARNLFSIQARSRVRIRKVEKYHNIFVLSQIIRSPFGNHFALHRKAARAKIMVNYSNTGGRSNLSIFRSILGRVQVKSNG